MTKFKQIFYIPILFLTLSNCKEEKLKNPILSNHEIPKVIALMTDIMVHDITNPPLAARFFSFAAWKFLKTDKFSIIKVLVSKISKIVSIWI